MRTCLLERLLQGMAGFIVVTCLAAVAVAQTPEARIGIAMARAQEVGIPISLLESKRAEGNAKGIPIEKIATAVETRLQHLEHAKVALSRGVTDFDAALLSVGADAIATGVSESVLTEIASAAGKDRRAVAVAALTYLVSGEGLASNVALTRVKAALQKGPDGLTDLMSGPGVAAGPGKSNSPGNARGQKNEAGQPAAISAPGQGKPSKPPKKAEGARGEKP